MKYLLLVCLAVLVGAETVSPPYAPEAKSGKELYAPLAEIVDKEEEKRVQQQEGIIGANGAKMHSYVPLEATSHQHGASR